MEKLTEDNDSDLEIVFEDEDMAENLQIRQKAGWMADADFEFISGITIEVGYGH